jgi:hypothetical protein
MGIEVKALAGLVIIILLGLGGFLGYRSAYDSGQMAGEAEIQTQFDQFKIESAKAAAGELATVIKERDDAIANNEAVTHDLQTQLSASVSNADSLVKRVSDYQARLSASADALRQAAGDKDAAVAAGIAASQGRLTQAIAAYDGACQRDALRLTQLIAEITPQL